MPNWTMNELTVTGPAPFLKEFRDFVKSDDSDFDFNRILPMPDALDIESGSTVYQGMNAYYHGTKEFMELAPECRELTRRAISNHLIHGFQDWYHWRNAKWGTKWNACDVYLYADEESLRYSFDTAWVGPEGICKAVLEMFPELEFRWQCLYDGDTGYENDEGEWIDWEWEENPNVYSLVDLVRGKE